MSSNPDFQQQRRQQQPYVRNIDSSRLIQIKCLQLLAFSAESQKSTWWANYPVLMQIKLWLQLKGLLIIFRRVMTGACLTEVDFRSNSDEVDLEWK